MTFRIQRCIGDPEEDRAIASLLMQVFAGEGYTDRVSAERMSSPGALRRRGDVLLAWSGAGDLIGMAICVPPASEARQVAELDEVELHLLAVHPAARGNGVAAALIAACEQQASFLRCRKIILSTQPTMRTAHRVYEKLGYQRNPDRDWFVAQTGKHYLVYEKCLS